MEYLNVKKIEDQEKPVISGNLNLVKLLSTFTYDKYRKTILPDREDGSRLSHAENLISTMETYLAYIPDELRAAAYMKDIVHTYYDFCSNDESSNQVCFEMMHDFLSNLYSVATDESSRKFLDTALGFAISAYYYDDAAKQWRGKISEKMSTEFDKLSEENSKYPEFYSDIYKCINGHEDADPSRIPLDYRVPVADIDLMLHRTYQWDIEGLILQTVDALENIRSPRKASPSSDWRNAQELYSFHAPLHDLGGMAQLSMRAYSESILKLYPEDYNRIIERAFDLYSNGEALQEEVINTLNVSADKLIAEFLNKDKNEENTLFANLFEEFKNSSFRLKSVGRILDKARTIALKSLNTKGIDKKVTTVDMMEALDRVPDTIALRCILPDELLEGKDEVDILKKMAVMLVGKVEKAPDAINEGKPSGSFEPVVEINVGTDTPNSLENIDGITVEVGPKRKSGYQAVHINMNIKIGGITNIGIEVQIVSESMEEINSTKAHHILYIQSNGNGENFTNEEQLNSIREIKARFSEFKNGHFGQTIAAQHTVSELLKKFGIKDQI